MLTPEAIHNYYDANLGGGHRPGLVAVYNLGYATGRFEARQEAGLEMGVEGMTPAHALFGVVPVKAPDSNS